MAKFKLNNNYWRNAIGFESRKLFIAICLINSSVLTADDYKSFETKLTTEDLAKALELNLLKLNFKLDKKVAGAILTYRVESVHKGGKKTICDEVAIGLGSTSQNILFRLPNGESASYGIFGKLNSSTGHSKLRVNVETNGSESWLHTKEKSIPPGYDFILAIRTLGGQDILEAENLQESLKKIRAAKFNRIDIFIVRIKIL